MSGIVAYLKFLYSLSEPDHYEWAIAIRRKGDNSLFEGNDAPFTLVKNPDRYWLADPFVAADEKKEFLFAEMYDRITGKGVLGVARIRNGKCGRFRVFLKNRHHLSYPCVFKKDGVFYLIPECNQSGEISVYKCKAFPSLWEKEENLMAIPAVDTTPVYLHGDLLYLTSDISRQSAGYRGNICLIKDGKLITLLSDNPCLRSAGKIIESNNRVIRPAQDCTERYGCALLFNEIDQLSESGLLEHTILRIVPPTGKKYEGDLEIRLTNVSNIRITGIHTYNSDDMYEVIDLRMDDTTKLHYFSCFFKHFAAYIKGKLSCH